MYAIRNIKTGQWMYGTDSNCNPPKQKTSYEKAKLFDSQREVLDQIRRRKITRKEGQPDEWEVVEVMLIEKPIITEEIIKNVISMMDKKDVYTQLDSKSILKDINTVLKFINKRR